MLSAFAQDLRYALRSLARTPVTLAVAVLSLALGIAANTTVFSAVDAFMLRPLPYPEEERLVSATLADPESGQDRIALSVPGYLDWRSRSRAVELAALADAEFSAGGEDARPLRGARVSAGFFRVMGLPLLAGRGFAEGEERAGADRVAVIGEGLWRNRFGASPQAVGSALELDGERYTVVGVAPEELAVPGGRLDVWVPLGITGREGRAQRTLQVIGRVRDGATLEGARREMEAVQARVAAENPTTDVGLTAALAPLHEQLFSPASRRATRMVMVAVAFVLLIACVNVAQLLLVRAVGREREIAVRRALGAGAGRIVRQLLVESLVIALLGGLLGLLLTFWGVRALVAILPEQASALPEVTVSTRVMAYTLGVSLLSALLFGLAPALQASRRSVRDALGAGRGGPGGVRRGRALGALVVAEVALALVLLVSAGLLVRSFVRVQGADLGFDPQGVLTFRLPLPEGASDDPARAAALLEPLEERLGRLPGVRAVGATSVLPMSGSGGRSYLPEGEAPPAGGRRPTVAVRAVTAGYHGAMGIPLAAGRLFTPADRAGAAPVAVVNQAMARRHWPAGAVGRRIVFDSATVEIVGVVRDTRDWGPQNEAFPMVYLPLLQDPPAGVSFALRAGGGPGALAPAVRRTVREADASLTVQRLQPMSAIVERTTAPAAVLARLLSAFALLALLLAVVGVYGVVAYTVGQRTQEIGVRMAMGAASRDVLAMVLRRGAALAALGIGVGLLLAAGATRGLRAYTAGVSALDPVAFGGGALALLAAAVVASLVPALRATRVEPTVALRYE